MGSLIGACAGACCAGMCCGAFRECSGHKTGAISRMPYILLFFLAGIFAIVMSLYGEKQLDLKFTTVTVCNSDSCNEGNGSVYRVSFCLFVFELIHVIVIGAGAVSFHWLWFVIKMLLFAGALAATFLIGNSNSFFDGFADYFARYLSAIYLLIQILILISWGYETNEYLITKSNEVVADDPENRDRDEDEQKTSCNKYLWFLVLGSFVIYALAFTGLGLFFPWYVPDAGCSLHETLIIMTIVFCVLTGVLSGAVGNSSFFVSAVVSFYCMFLLFSALQADTTCNTFGARRDTVSLWVGYILTFCAIFYAALRADAIGLLFLGPPTEDKEESAQPLLPDSNYNDDNNSAAKHKATGSDADIMATEADLRPEEKEADSNSKPVNSGGGDEEAEMSAKTKALMRRHNVYFHSVMMLAACYFSMLFSNWTTNSTGNISLSGNISMWVNMACQYVTLVLFWQTLLAPIICPSRFANAQREDED